MKRGLKNRLRDGEAFDRLVEEHYDDVLAYCRRHAPFYDDAPDVAQEAFLRFVRSGRSPLDGKPLAYLFTIARNLCIDAARARRLPVGPLDVDVLGVSRFAVNRRLNRALAELRRGLEGKDEA